MKLIVQYFEWYLDKNDNLWKKVVEETPLLKRLGVTDVWLPPAYKGKKGSDDSGYGVYDLYDLGEFDQKGSIRTKYGTREEYLDAISSLQASGINVLADIVLNHKLGADCTEAVLADRYDEEERSQVLERVNIDAWTGFDFKKRNNKYSDFKWNKQHFTSVDYDQLNEQSGLYKFVDKEWSNNIDEELENYDYLMGADVDFNDDEVINEYLNWGKWYLEVAPVNGFRLDAIKHIDFDFFPLWLKALRQNKELFVVGEYWSSDVRALENYLMESEYTMQLFDVALHYNLYDASLLKADYDLRDIFKNTLVLNQPEYAVTFVDNHDTQTGQSLESMVLPWFREIANALILLRNGGIPCVFYLDLYDDNIQKLMELRSLKSKTVYDYFDDPECIGFSYNCNQGLTVLISNGEARFKKMFVGRHHAQKVFIDQLGNCDEEVIINEKGIGVFKVEAQSVSVYSLKGNEDD